MASIRFKFRASTVSGKQGTLFIQVIHRRVARQVSTQYKLYPGEWDSAGQSVTVPKDTLPDRSRYLHAVQEALQQDASRLQLIILALDHSRKEYQAEDVIRHFLRKEQSDEFTIFADKLIRQKKGGRAPIPCRQIPDFAQQPLSLPQWSSAHLRRHRLLADAQL